MEERLPQGWGGLGVAQVAGHLPSKWELNLQFLETNGLWGGGDAP
jgi:hypothetical protein